MRKKGIMGIHSRLNLSKCNKIHHTYPYLLRRKDITSRNGVGIRTHGKPIRKFMNMSLKRLGVQVQKAWQYANTRKDSLENIQ